MDYHIIVSEDTNLYFDTLELAIKVRNQFEGSPKPIIYFEGEALPEKEIYEYRMKKCLQAISDIRDNLEEQIAVIESILSSEK